MSRFWGLARRVKRLLVPPADPQSVTSAGARRWLARSRASIATLIAAAAPRVPRDGLILDVGANMGQFSRMLMDEIGFRGAAHLFEPVHTAPAAHPLRNRVGPGASAVERRAERVRRGFGARLPDGIGRWPPDRGSKPHRHDRRVPRPDHSPVKRNDCGDAMQIPVGSVEMRGDASGDRLSHTCTAASTARPLPPGEPMASKSSRTKNSSPIFE